MITCAKRYDNFPFGHKQPNHAGHCRFIHGHNWGFEFEFAAGELDACGFVVDFGGLGGLKAELAAHFDHTFLINADDPDLELFKGLPCHGDDPRAIIDLVVVEDCSCEGVAALAYRLASESVRELTGGRAHVVRCTVFEDSKNSATYRPD